MYLQILSWTALRSLGPEFFTVCNGMSTSVDITFSWLSFQLFLMNSVASWIYAYFYNKFCRFFRYQDLPRSFSNWGQEPWNSELLTCCKIWCNTIVCSRANNTGFRANRSEFYLVGKQCFLSPDENDYRCLDAGFSILDKQLNIDVFPNWWVEAKLC